MLDSWENAAEETTPNEAPMAQFVQNLQAERQAAAQEKAAQPADAIKPDDITRAFDTMTKKHGELTEGQQQQLTKLEHGLLTGNFAATEALLRKMTEADRTKLITATNQDLKEFGGRLIKEGNSIAFRKGDPTATSQEVTKFSLNEKTKSTAGYELTFGQQKQFMDSDDPKDFFKTSMSDVRLAINKKWESSGKPSTDPKTEDQKDKPTSKPGVRH